MEKTTYSVEETHRLGREILENLGTNIIALEGDLGSGKTTFSQGVGKQLQIEEPITSPTFLLLKEYDITNHPKFKKLIHIDLYRVSNWDETEELYLEERWKDKKNLILIEWPERIEEKLPETTLTLKFEHIDSKSRQISY